MSDYKNGSIVGVSNTPTTSVASGIWDLNSVRDFIDDGTWPIGGNDAATVLLLHCDGTDASTTFTDSAQGGNAPHTVTVNANAQVDTAQKKFGTASALFDGTDDYLNLDGDTDFAFGSGDFTIECWVRRNATGAIHMLYDSRPAATQGLYPTIYVNSSDVLLYFTNSADRITGTTTLSSGQWYHVAVTRSGTSTKLFLNGTQEGSTYTDSNTYLNGASRPVIGASGYSVTILELNGWIDEVRVSKGAARWTANFTPPASPYT